MNDTTEFAKGIGDMQRIRAGAMWLVTKLTGARQYADPEKEYANGINQQAIVDELLMSLAELATAVDTAVRYVSEDASAEAELFRDWLETSVEGFELYAIDATVLLGVLAQQGSGE